MSALLEICHKMHSGVPVYELVHSSGPSNKMNFLYEVLISVWVGTVLCENV